MQSVFQQAEITIFKHYLIPSFTFAADNPPTRDFCSSDCSSMCSAATDSNTALFAKTWIRRFTSCPAGITGPFRFRSCIYLL